MGSFWFEGRRWLAHRWAAAHIHGLEIDGKEVIAECDDPLCVQHLSAIVPAGNSAQHYTMVAKGALAPTPARPKPRPDEAWHEEPDWLKPFVPVDQRVKVNPDGLPF